MVAITKILREKNKHIIIYCKKCGKATMHYGVKPFPASTERNQFWSYKIAYRCVLCGNLIKATIKVRDK